MHLCRDRNIALPFARKVRKPLRSTSFFPSQLSMLEPIRNADIINQLKEEQITFRLSFETCTNDRRLTVVYQLINWLCDGVMTKKDNRLCLHFMYVHDKQFSHLFYPFVNGLSKVRRKYALQPVHIINTTETELEIHTTRELRITTPEIVFNRSNNDIRTYFFKLCTVWKQITQQYRQY